MTRDSDAHPPSAFPTRQRARLLAALVCMTLAIGCGADGTEAPYLRPPEQRCLTLDERLDRLLQALEAQQLESFEVVLERLQTEREGARLERAIRLLMRVLQAMPRHEAGSFEYQLAFELVEQTRDPLINVLAYLRTGPDTRREAFGSLSVAFVECPRDSFVLTLKDFFENTDLLAALGDTFNDPRIVGLLANLPTEPDQGRTGFVALVRAVMNAVTSPSFNFAQVRELLSFLNLDEPPVSSLMTELERYFEGEGLENIRTTVICLGQQEHEGLTGTDAIGGLLYDLMTLDGLELGELLTVIAPILEQIEDPELQTIGSAIIDAFVEDLELRDLAIELFVFLLREDNLVPVLESLEVLLRSRGLDDVLLVMEGLTVRCSEPQ